MHSRLKLPEWVENERKKCMLKKKRGCYEKEEKSLIERQCLFSPFVFFLTRQKCSFLSVSHSFSLSLSLTSPSLHLSHSLHLSVSLTLFISHCFFSLSLSLTLTLSSHSPCITLFFSFSFSTYLSQIASAFSFFHSLMALFQQYVLQQ